MEEKHSKQERIFSDEQIDFWQGSHQIDVGFTATFTAAVTFFTGIIISQYKSFDPSINIPTLMLIISTFGFLYSTLVYSNISGILLHGKFQKAARCAILGNILSEYLGVYFIIFAIPLIINIISQDLVLRLATLAFNMCGLYIYHISGFSIMERHYKKLHMLFMLILIFFEVLLFYFQYANKALFEASALLLILFVFTLAFLAKKETV